MYINAHDDYGCDQQPVELIDFLSDETNVHAYILPIFTRQLLHMMDDTFCRCLMIEIGKLLLVLVNVKDKSEIVTDKFIDDVTHRILSARNNDEQVIRIRQLCDAVVNRVVHSERQLFQMKHFHKTKLSRTLSFLLIYYIALAVSENN
jgi:hypothetical protein